MEQKGERKVALITGITGQDGSYLAEFLIAKGYIVHGIIRRSSAFNTGRIEHLYADVNSHQEGKMVLHYGDLLDGACLVRIVTLVQPTEIYNLAAMSHVKVSFEMAEYTADVVGVGTLRLLEAIRTCGLEKKVKFYQASTSELFGKVKEVPQNEATSFNPQSPYAVAKLFAHWTVINFREAYGMFCCNGLTFNHESPRRGENFVTRKITQTVAKIHLGLMETLNLGNLDASLDWGHARDYVEAFWTMLQQKEAEDFVIGTGKMHSVRDFVNLAFNHVGVEIEWEGEGVSEVGKDNVTGKVRVQVDPKFFRPMEEKQRLADITKAKTKLGWQPKSSFNNLVQEMMDCDIELMKSKHGYSPKFLQENGHKLLAKEEEVKKREVIEEVALSKGKKLGGKATPNFGKILKATPGSL